MTLRRPVRPALALAVALAVVTGGSALAGTHRRPHVTVLGPNLVLNPSFEQGQLDAVSATSSQPVLPVAWTFEGATVLFDYNTRGGHTGARQVAISGSLAPGKEICDASSGAYVCAPNPAYAATGAAEAAALPTYSIRPYWVTAAPVPVTAGKTYRFSAWMIRPSLAPDAGVLGEGAATKVRWVDAGGNTVAMADGPASVKGPHRSIGWKYGSTDLVAPPGAAGAKLLLGMTDYLVTSAQVAFDDIGFQQVQ